MAGVTKKAKARKGLLVNEKSRNKDTLHIIASVECTKNLANILTVIFDWDIC